VSYAFRRSCRLATPAQLTHYQSQSYVTTDDQSANMSWCQATTLGPKPYFYHCQTVAGSLMWAACLTRGRCCRLQLLLAVANAVIVGSESCGANDHILLPQIRDSPSVEGQVPVFTFPRNRMNQLYRQALGSFSVACYDSHGYGGGIRTCLHSGIRVRVTLRVAVYCQSEAGD
jgi:hypothetical protein